jgi:predicted GTPase
MMPLEHSNGRKFMPDSRRRTRVVVLGAAGRDFHNFNVVYRDDPAVEVVAFTAAQIPGIGGRRYPPELSGRIYPHGIPIVAEAALETLISERAVDLVVFAYSDVRHDAVMHLASRALAAGADFALLGAAHTMLRAGVPVIAVSAVRTGCGKSQVARYLAQRLRGKGLRVAVVRHPMPYGDLAAARVQRFAARGDLDAAACTIEEREEYEPHLAAGNVVFAGVDYAAIVARAEAEADLILWDGGNNDFPFLRPDLHIVLVDALRPGQETGYHPGEAVLRMADIVLVAKADAAPAAVARIAESVRAANAGARLLRGGSPVTLADPGAVRGRRVLAVEDGPTITHGGMPHGAAVAAAREAGAAGIVDPRPWAVPDIAPVYAQYPHIGPVLPAMGYSSRQIAALAATLNAADADVIVAGTPVDLAGLMELNKPIVRARYEFVELEQPGLWDAVEQFLDRRKELT